MNSFWPPNRFIIGSKTYLFLPENVLILIRKWIHFGSKIDLLWTWNGYIFGLEMYHLWSGIVFIFGPEMNKFWPENDVTCMYPWISTNIHGYLWIPIDIHGYPWTSMDSHGYPRICISIDIHGFGWLAFAYISNGFIWYPWISMDIQIHGYPWMSMDIHGYPWIWMVGICMHKLIQWLYIISRDIHGYRRQDRRQDRRHIHGYP